MAKANTNPINNINTSWEGYSGKRVEEFIKNELKSKCGFIYSTKVPESDGHNYFYGFYDEETYDNWLEDPTIKPLFKIQFPELQNSIFTGKLTSDINVDKTLINLGKGIKIKFKYTSTLTDPTSQEITDTGNSGTLVIYRDANNTGFVEIASEKILSVDHNNNNWSKEIDIANYLVVGSNRLRFRVIDDNGNISNTLIFNSIINTTLTLKNTTSTTAKLEGNSFDLYYAITGRVGKTLHIQIEQNNEIKYENHEINIGEETYANERSLKVTITNHNCKTGMIKVISWLTVNEDSSLKSEIITNQFYYSDGFNSDNISVLLNNIITNDDGIIEIDNNSTIHFFDYVVYSNSNNNVMFNVIIKDKYNNKIYLNVNETSNNDFIIGQEKPFNKRIEIQNNNNDYINAKLIISTKLDNEDEFNINHSYDVIIYDKEKINPTEGADLIINPNNNYQQGQIINDTDNKPISSTFTGFDYINDGWCYDNDGNRILRIPSGHLIDIKYDPFKDVIIDDNNGTIAKQGVTIEIDFKVYNIFNDNDIVFNISKEDINDNITQIGFVMQALHAYFHTNNLKDTLNQDVMFQENERTHMTINIISIKKSENNNDTLNYIRIFINGVLNREMVIADTDSLKQTNKDLSIQIGGSDNCDIDIYGIRIYKFGLTNLEILNDYIFSISDVEKRKEIKELNNIIDYDRNNTISYELAKNKYNTLIWESTDFLIDKDQKITNINIPCYDAKNKNPDVDYMPGGKLIINKFKRNDITGEYERDDDGNLIIDKYHSGYITNLRCKGQGSSSKTYWKWNQQYDWNKLEQKDENGNTIKDENDEPITIDSIWTDLNNDIHTDGYRLTDDDPPATKLVAKLNWASSMQSHKIGSTALYTDLWREIVGGNSMTKYCANTPNVDLKKYGYLNDARVSVHEEPFLFFVKTTENSTPEFYGLMTFGSGKYDKKTFGYDKKIFSDYLIIEGTDNGRPLTLRQVPWFEDEVEYNADKEWYEYPKTTTINNTTKKGIGCWDYGMGNRNNISYFIEANNFVYEHSIRLLPCKVYIENQKIILKDPNNENILLEDRSYQYWDIKSGNIYRWNYNFGEEGWVNGGITKTNGQYDEFNVFDQTSINKPNNGNLNDYYDYNNYNEQFKEWRINDFKNYDFNDDNSLNNGLFSDVSNTLKIEYNKGIGHFYNIDDVLYSIAFLKFIAATDNRCKNTYEYLDPITYKICLAQDDMDTIVHIDNVGRNNKPYYVEEYDSYKTIENGNIINHDYFNGIDNNFFMLMDKAYPMQLEKMLEKIFIKMSSGGKFGSSVFNCLQKYFFNVQEYFSAVTFNETARLLYEEAQIYWGKEYKNNISPMLQSLGNQLEAEKQWFNKRIIYFNSLLELGVFSKNRGLNLRPAEVGKTSYFHLKPCQWLYPKIESGESTFGGLRTEAYVEYNGSIGLGVESVKDQNFVIRGEDYYTSFGEFGEVNIVGDLPLTGNHLIEFSADKTKFTENTSQYKFNITTISKIEAQNLKKLIINGCESLTGEVNLNLETKLEYIDLRGCTSLGGVILPQTGNLKEVYLPSLSNLTLVNCPNIETITFESYLNFTGITMDNIKNINVTTNNFEIFENILYYSKNINKINLTDIDINLSNYTYTKYDNENENISNKMYKLLINNSSNCEGHIILNKKLTFEEQQKLIKKYNSINLSNRKLYIEYDYIHGEGYIKPYIDNDMEIPQGKQKIYKLIYNGNDIYQYTWVVVDNNGNPVTYKSNENPWEITVTAPNNSTSETINISVTLNRKEATTLTYNLDPIRIIENQSIESILIDTDNLYNDLNNINNVSIDNNSNILCESIGNYNIPIKYSPERYTIPVKSKEVLIIEENIQGINEHFNIINNTANNNLISYNYNKLINISPINIKVQVKIIDENNKIIFNTFNFKLINPIKTLYLDNNSNIIWNKNN